ncbi:MAG: phosphoribosylglycinamide formyltransferase [Thermoleophilia bacterium]|nr:phosphoribosylglycinamide formyltransferase [Thermoleophilia bacterium]
MIGVLVSGEGTNLQALLDEGLPVFAVASNRPGVPALSRAERAGVPAAVFELEEYATREARDLAMAAWLAARGVEVVVCAGYMHLLTPPFLARFPALNVHPSLLPAFPGAHAVEDALDAGVPETGVTVHFLDEGVDTGPIVVQERVPVRPSDTRETLAERIHAVEHRLLPDAARRWLEQRSRLPAHRDAVER